MDKVVIPDELKTDHEMVNLYTQYEKLIDEFWKTYSEHNKVERQAAEAAELKKDIKKMETDTVKLKELVETQKEKVAAIPNNSTLMVLAKDYHDANSESKKLEEQMKQQQKAIDNIDLEIKHLKGELERKKSLYPSSEDPVKVIKEEVHINKILANNKLPEELNSLKGEREIYTTVSSEPDPTQSDIDKLATDIETINNEIKELQGKVATNASDDKLAPFRNQSKIIANKKNELAATVMDLKHEIEITETKIAEKRNTLQGILGGPAMYGTELKQYISNVRDRCNLYKELRAQEQAMRSELGVLNRTIEILQSLDPGLVKALENNTENVTQTADLNLPDDDLQTKSKALTKEIAKKRAEVLEKREKVLLTKKDIDVLMKDYKALQQEFEEATQPIRKKLETVETEIALLESTIKEQEEHYKTLQQQIEKNETILQSLSEDLENDVNESVNKPSQVELIKTKLNVQQEKNKRLKQELRIMEEMKVMQKVWQRLRVIIYIIFFYFRKVNKNKRKF